MIQKKKKKDELKGERDQDMKSLANRERIKR